MLISFDRIHAIAKQIAEEFNPERIYLFGSYAYGKPTEDSDLDLLVVMPSPDPKKPAFYAAGKIRYTLPRDISIDLLVRDPIDFEVRVKGFDGFLSTIAQQGVLLYQQEGPSV